MGTTFSREQLEAKTAKELKRMCVYELDLPGLTKKSKEVVIDAIMLEYGEGDEPASLAAAPAQDPGVTGVEATMRSVVTNPSAAFGQRSTTTLHVSCGASSGNFPVVGRSVKQVGEFLREVLNVDQLSTGLVNGKEVGPDYVLKQGDNLEFLKPAGKKGC